MKKLIFIIIILVICIPLISQTTIPAGNVSGNWTISGSPYLIEGEITIPNEETLIIDPGCIIEFQDHYKFNVQGRLLSIGTEQDSIKFTAADTTGFYPYNTPEGGWDGLHFEQIQTLNDSSVIKYSIFEYGNAIGSWRENCGGAIHCYGLCNLYLESCLFINNASENYGGAIYTEDSIVIIYNCMFKNNYAFHGGAVYYRSSEYGLFNNIFTENFAAQRGGALYLNNSSCFVKNNIFSNNYTNNGGAIYFYGNEYAIIVNNIICNNSANYGGGCLFFANSGIKFINNTIINNFGHICGGLDFEFYDNTEIYNSLIYNNENYYGKHQILVYYGNTNPSFYNCNIQGGYDGFSFYDESNYIGDYLDNIDYPPMFTDPTLGAGVNYNGLEADWSLQSGSVCINHGIADTTGLNLPDIDFAGNPRIFIGNDPRIDIGAYEFQGEPDQISGIMINPDWLDFGIHTVNTFSEVKNITIRNIGFSNLEISNITAPAGFLLKRNNYPQFGSFITPFSIEPDSTEIINIIFQPLAAGYFEENIVIYSNDSNFPVSNINVSGTGDIWPTYGGIIENDTFWDSDTVKIVESVIVDSGVTVCVEPGTTVQVYENCSILIQGSIVAEGTIEDSIIFTSVPNEYIDYWGGLKFVQTPVVNDSSKFNYCVFSNSKSSSGGALYIQEYSKLYFMNCTFKDNIAEQDNGNGYGGGMTLSYSSPLITNCIFETNVASGRWDYSGSGGGIAIFHSSPIISNCIFRNNIAIGDNSNRGGGIYCVSYSNAIISGTVISNNSAENNYWSDWFGGGVYCMQSTLKIESSLIANNFSGGGVILDWWSNSTVVNSTIVNNSEIGLSCNSSPNIINNIIWSNENQVNIVHNFADPNFYYCNIQGGFEAFIGDGVNTYSGDYENNINEDPLFLQTGNHPYQLTELSPCIDTGIPDTTGLDLPPWDIVGNERIWDGDGDGIAIIDMGTYEYGAPPYVDVNDNIIVQATEILLQQNYPNPFNPTTTINFSIPKNSKIDLSIFNIKGQKVKTLANSELTKGTHSIIWNSDDDYNKPVSSGVYLYKLNVDGKTEAVKKCLLLK
ncbi:MAG: choice-of-anchor Q domain-containing protein [Candidatus Tenebribacter burtonii]|nr:choice-of-anchor Q domain-containing protein [Candidatus Tenebribacter burtonii]